MISSDSLLSLTLLGESHGILKLRNLIKRTACFDAPVLILGETGTGKELVARSLHYCSSRADNAFVPTNCGAISDELFLSEMFGHERGAFTDAKKSRTGLLEQANHGTLFLDEIDSLSLKSQVALLRFLQENEFRSVGGSNTKQADVRVLAASNQDLSALVEQGKFREDLYFRLDVLNIRVPALRQRSGDALILGRHFIQQVCDQHNLPVKVLSQGAEEWINNYSWPGNVRELENWIKRCCFLSETEAISATDETASHTQKKGATGSGRNLNADHSSAPVTEPFREAKCRVIEQFEENYVNELLEQCSGNISQAAKIANKDRRAFGRLVKKYGVDKGQFC